jgi:hypothetical protein
LIEIEIAARPLGFTALRVDGIGSKVLLLAPTGNFSAVKEAVAAGLADFLGGLADLFLARRIAAE